MKVVSVYQTADGKQFANKEDARRHEVECETLDKLRNLLKTSIDSAYCQRGNIDNVLRNILLESAEVRNILLSYGKRMPKEQPAAAA
jgi:adenine-specific DNA methylase